MTKSTGKRPRYGSDLATKLAFYSAPPDANGCIIWMGARHSRKVGTSYGSLNWKGVSQRVHRLAWELANNRSIPEGMHICHRCDVPPCLNPAHLFLGTVADNMADRDAKGRQADRKGEKHGRAKLTETQVLAIRQDPRGKRSIARSYGVSPNLIRLIRQRKAWSHI